MKHLIESNKLTIWVSGSDLFCEYNKSGNSFTLQCELHICTWTGLMKKVIVVDYDGCTSFSKAHVLEALKLHNPNIVVDFTDI